MHLIDPGCRGQPDVIPWRIAVEKQLLRPCIVKKIPGDPALHGADWRSAILDQRADDLGHTAVVHSNERLGLPPVPQRSHALPVAAAQMGQRPAWNQRHIHAQHQALAVPSGVQAGVQPTQRASLRKFVLQLPHIWN